MKVLFIDFDGVLNSHHYNLFRDEFEDRYPTSDPNEADIRRMLWDVDPRLAFNLKFVTEKCPDLRFVISSTWRRHFRLDQFMEMFLRLGFNDGLVIGATPFNLDRQKFSESVPRIAEIDAWRKENNIPWSDCVILDDYSVAPDCDGSKWLPEEKEWEQRFVQTDQRDGFTYARAWDVLDLLMGQDGWKAPVILM